MSQFKPKSKLQPPDDGESFHFPFPPYDIQLDLMRSLYTVVEEGKIGIFESPTGTGKSLSLTCAVLTWLRDHESLYDREMLEQLKEMTAEIARLEKENERTEDWISGQFSAIEQRKELGELQTFHDAMVEYRKRLQALKTKAVQEKRWKKLPAEGDAKCTNALKDVVGHQEVIDEDDFLPEDDADCDDDPSEETDPHVGPQYKPLQVIFCSRTHSQLSQVVGEIKSTAHGKELRLTSLASRQSLCINPEVRKLKSSTLMNERCLELMKKSSKVTVKDSDERGKKRQKVSMSCPFYNQRAIESLKNDTLFEVQDIEDLVTRSKREKACPYYASRLAIPDSQFLMVPYQLILHRRTREQSGIDLRNSVVIIDEAHNLLDTIANIHSQQLSLEQLQQTRHSLVAYKARYFARFTTKNLLKINQLIFIAAQLSRLLDMKVGKAEPELRMFRTQQLMVEGRFFNLDLLEILKFCERCRIAQKVHGFAQTVPKDAPEAAKAGPSNLQSFLKQLEQGSKKGTGKQREKAVSSAEGPSGNGNQENMNDNTNRWKSNSIRPFLAFLECLIETFDDGRVLLSLNPLNPEWSTLTYFLLNPGARFGDILQSCRSLILAGGTMQPTNELTEQLFRDCPERVVLKSYRHVVPKDAVLPLAIARGPTGKDLIFNYRNRNSPELLAELQSTISNICQVVPNGIVCFFSSYDYLDCFYRRLEEKGNLRVLEERKRVFREPRVGGNVDQMLQDYGRAARSPGGALLLSVVGGKLSEGLNFSDELGRCVVVVGLSYPFISLELHERMRYLDATLHASAGREYYENLCMKAVNQCIGRAVRHIRDYAAVVLLDVRYCTSDRIRGKLPSWISESLTRVERYGQAHGTLAKFFRQKREC